MYMKILNSTVGWRRPVMNTRLLVCSLFLVVGCGIAVAKEALPPDLEMLEFLGTFETSGGKDIDPFLLEGEPKQVKQPDKSESKGGGTKRKPGEKEKDGKHDN
jgi:hypothetical protein